MITIEKHSCMTFYKKGYYYAQIRPYKGAYIIESNMIDSPIIIADNRIHTVLEVFTQVARRNKFELDQAFIRTYKIKK